MAENDTILEILKSKQDPAYRDFQCRLMPTVDPDTVIGVRTPNLRAIAREISGSEDAERFLSVLPHRFYEENNLHGFLIERIKDCEKCISAIDEFLPYVDNWATCDLMSPKIFRKNITRLREKADEWMASDRTYTIRFGIEMLMSFCLDEYFDTSIPDSVAGIRSEEYYVNMMIAWFFATALAKQWDAALPYIENKCLDKWTHNKAIQKAVESYRITPEQKAFLRTLKQQ